MSRFAVIKAVEHLKANPRDAGGRDALKNALYVCSKNEFIGGGPPSKWHMAALGYEAAGHIVSRWEDEGQRWVYIRIADELMSALSKKLKMPKPRRAKAAKGEAVDLKKRAAGDV